MKLVQKIANRRLKGAGVPPLPLEVCPMFREYVKATKNLDLDVWQIDMCNRLEKAFWIAQAEVFDESIRLIDIGIGRPRYICPSGFAIDKDEFEQERGHATSATIAAPPQFGKSIIISQAYPAWILGQHPLHRFRLATYNVFHSARFSRVIKHLMQSPEHKQMFPDPAGHLPLKSKATEWSTNARIELNDGQASFSALGLQSGFTGTGFDTLLQDDPYKDRNEAFSPVIREKTWLFWTDTARPRRGEHSNVFIMFHRYHQDDQGGRAIASKEFVLWRYAAQADGSYEDPETGISFADPLGRKEGEYLSKRFSAAYYEQQKKNEDVWYSQFQGRPTSKTGSFFNTSMLHVITLAEMPPIIHWIRAWDNAATQDGGAFSVGLKMGIDATGKVYITDVKRDQVNTAGRKTMQLEAAREDGEMVPIHGPEDPGSAGVDVASEFLQDLGREGFNAIATKVSGSKEARAYNASEACNNGTMYLVDTGWNIKAFRNELALFPVGTYKDQVDSLADAYNYLKRMFYRGLVLKTYTHANLLERSLFVEKFGPKIQAHWEVSVSVRLAADSSRPSGWAIMARAAEDARIGERVFVVAAGREFVPNLGELLAKVRAALVQHCAKGDQHPRVIWIRSDGSDIVQVASQKHGFNLTRWDDDDTCGLPELNWYFQLDERETSPFYPLMKAAHAYCVVDDLQMGKAENEDGLLAFRQEATSWSYNDKGKPQPLAGITVDCVRMLLYNFALTATGLTPKQKQQAKLPEHLRDENVRAKLGTEEFVAAYWAQQHAISVIDEQDRIIKRKGASRLGPRAVQRRFKLA